MYPDFLLDLTWFSPEAQWEAPIPIYGDQDEGILGLLSHISICGVEHVYLKLQVTNGKMKEVASYHKLQTLEKIDLLKTLNPSHQMYAKP